MRGVYVEKSCDKSRELLNSEKPLKSPDDTSRIFVYLCKIFYNLDIFMVQCRSIHDLFGSYLLIFSKKISYFFLSGIINGISVLVTKQNVGKNFLNPLHPLSTTIQEIIFIK